MVHSYLLKEKGREREGGWRMLVLTWNKHTRGTHKRAKRYVKKRRGREDLESDREE
jgi:hypothetical protein